jgi:DNA invertase Pin-like site-specific DNA recombinase
MKRIALYFRVSTDDQTTEPQRIELREYCTRRGWENVTEYADKISGAKFTRLGLNRLMNDVRNRRIDAVVCVKLDRLGRSLPHMAQIIAEMDANQVALIATSQGIDTSRDNPAGRLQMHVLMAVAEFERSLIKERTKAGLEAARARGSRLGRPPMRITADQERTISEHMAAYGRTHLASLSVKLGCSIAKTHLILKEHGKEVL